MTEENQSSDKELKNKHLIKLQNQQLKTLKKANEDLATEISNLKDANINLNTEISNLKDKGNSDAEVNELKETNSKLTTEVTSLKTEIASSDAVVNELKETISDIKECINYEPTCANEWNEITKDSEALVGETCKELYDQCVELY
jgi:chromosome segregation ATPase